MPKSEEKNYEMFVVNVHGVDQHFGADSVEAAVLQYAGFCRVAPEPVMPLFKVNGEIHEQVCDQESVKGIVKYMNAFDEKVNTMVKKVLL